MNRRNIKCPYCGWDSLTLCIVIRTGKWFKRHQYQCNHCLWKGRESLYVRTAAKRFEGKDGSMTTRRERAR